MEPSYHYRARVVRWVDGDTVDLRIDCGFYIWWEGRFRLYGINTPERGQPGFQDATVRAEALAPPGTLLTAATYKADKYGRFLADLWTEDGVLVNQELINAGLAVPYYP